MPDWTIQSGGTENAILRLGDDMAVHLPRVQGKDEQLEKEHNWLPILAPLLPLSVPEPIAKGPRRPLPMALVYLPVAGG
jgi:aminoglycoside phosphotransferase (APT) family kinase protein